MSKLMEATTNKINLVQTNKVVTWKAILQQSIDEAKIANKITSKRGKSQPTILPMITEWEHKHRWRRGTWCSNDEPQWEWLQEHWRVQTPQSHVSCHWTRIMPRGRWCTWHDDDMVQHQIQFPKIDSPQHADTKRVCTCIGQIRIPINKPKLTLILLAKIHRAKKQEWGQEFQTAMSNIKKNVYNYDHVHDKKSLASIMKECASADSACSTKDTTAPCDTKAIAHNKSILYNVSADKYNNLSLEWSGGLPIFYHAHTSYSTRTSERSEWDRQSFAASSTTTEASIKKQLQQSKGQLQILQEIQLHFSTSNKGPSSQ